jgi:hypothetical protein
MNQLLKVSEIIEKYSYAKGYLCYKILMEELKNLDFNKVIKDPVDRMISEKKVESNFTFNAKQVFLTYNHTEGISKENFVSALKDKLGNYLNSYLIAQEKKGNNFHTHIYLTLSKRKCVSRQSYFDLTFVIKGKLETKSAYVEAIYNDPVAVVYYIKKSDSVPLTNMLLENGRVLTKREEKIDYLCRNKNTEEIWNYLNNDPEFENDIITRNKNFYNKIDNKIFIDKSPIKNTSNINKRFII